MKARARAESAQTSAKTLPDRIADELIARIFVGQLAPGDLLPAERALAQELSVDRTSLRMALRQLSRMKVIHAVRGSGIRVLDYRRHAGIDFLTAVLDVPGLELGSALLLEALDHWNAAMPAVTAQAFARATPAEIAALDGFFAQQLAVLDRRGPLAEVVDLELRMQDAIFALAGSTALGLLANSTRPLRRRLSLIQAELSDPRPQVTAQREQVRALLERRPDPEKQATAHRAQLVRFSEPLRRHLASLPANPWRSEEIFPLT
jgi:GntR family transcriptional regulator, transcriptional repressor for pyruvate dehydrogenase complex